MCYGRQQRGHPTRTNTEDESRCRTMTHDLLWYSGCKLELKKCRYHLVHFDLKDSGIPNMSHSPSESITLNNELGTNVKIESKNIYQTRINLWHSKCPKSIGIMQLKRSMKTAVRSTLDAIVQCRCSRTETRMLYQTVWKPSVRYTLDQSFLTEKQLNTIEKG